MSLRSLQVDEQDIVEQNIFQSRQRRILLHNCEKCCRVHASNLGPETGLILEAGLDCGVSWAAIELWLYMGR